MDAPRAELASASFLMLGNSLPSCSLIKYVRDLEYGSYTLKHEYYVRDKDGNMILENTITDESVEEVVGSEINTSTLEKRLENNGRLYAVLENNRIIIEKEVNSELIIKYVRDKEYFNFDFILEWNDENNKNDFRPATYLVSLVVNGEKKESYMKDSSEKTFTVPDLPREDENGNRISYSFDVQISERYAVTYDTNRDVYIATYNPSWFSVIIPKQIVLDGTTGTADYQVSGNGRFYYGDMLEVIPDKKVTLTDKARIESMQANVTQEKTLIISEKNILNGNIITDRKIFPGEWRGIFNFEIRFSTQKKNMQYKVELHDAKDGKILKEETRIGGNPGDAVLCNSKDFSYTGYIFDEHNSRNLTLIILSSNPEENVIRLYFLKEEYVTHIFMDGYTGAKLKQESMLEGTNLTVLNYPQVPNHTDEGLEFLKWEDGYFGEPGTEIEGAIYHTAQYKEIRLIPKK